MEYTLEYSGLAGKFCCMIFLGEGYINIKCITDVFANDLILKAGDELTGAQLQLMPLSLAAVECDIVNIAVEVDGDGA